MAEAEEPVVQLIEASCADMLKAIATDPELTPAQKVHWSCSIRIICEMQGRPPELCPARWTAQVGPTSRLHHTQRAGMAEKTLRNHLANFRATLAWFAREEKIPRRGGVCLDPEWLQLRNGIASQRDRSHLSGVMRFCSAQKIRPGTVNEAILDAYMRYRAATTNLKSDKAARRRIARSWNKCVGRVKGWPEPRLFESPVKPSSGPRLSDFPIALRTDIESYLTYLTKPRKTAAGKRLRPCARNTIDVRRAMLVALARRAVALGTPIQSLVSLSALLSPSLVERCLDTYSPADVPSSNTYAADLARLLVSTARATKCLGAEDIVQLDEMRAALDEDRGIGLTEKNAKLIIQVLSPGVWKRVRDLPRDLMLKARAVRDDSPVKAAVLAQMAAAIALLTVAPVRLSNLASIQLDINLQRLGGPRSPYRLVFPEYDVKNRIRLEFQLDTRVADLVDEYLHEHLHVLRRGSNELFLFPGEKCGHKGGATLSAQITQRVVKATGLRITVHQFRHAAGALLLHAQPGNYELVRRALGHKNIQTTINFYTHLQSLQATRILSDIVYGELDFESLPM